MKKAIFLSILLIIASLPVYAQGFYFDIGGNASFIMTGVTNKEAQKEILDFPGFGTGGGLKIGYGPFNMPLYIAGEFSVNSGNFISTLYDDYIRQGTLYFGGLGLIFYPVQIIQLGTSLGYSWQTITGGVHEPFPAYGFSWNISAAFDLGKRNHGLLIGLQYFGTIHHSRDEIQLLIPAINDPHISEMANLLLSDFGLRYTYLSIFVKYAFRQKVPQQTVSDSVAKRQSRSNAGINRAITRATQDLINKLPERSRVAVISISSNNGETSTYVIEELEYQLVTSGKFTIVDRHALDLIRSEQNFQMSGDVSDESAVSIGQMLGANIVITGSISGTGTSQRLIIRALDVRTAEIITMVREEF